LNFTRLFKKFKTERDRQIFDLISETFGVSPKELSLYITALRHKSAAKNIYNGNAASNERLEFLGDAVLDAAVADYLFDKYPDAEEGEMTKIKSRIVSRDNLNLMARKMGVPDLLETDAQAARAKDSIAGNALEALFGAMYCDLGYPKTRIATMRALNRYTDLETLEYEEADFKSRLYEEAHRRKVDLRFDTTPHSTSGGDKYFVSTVFFDDQMAGKGKGSSKKRAEQSAAEAALDNLNVK